MLKHQKLFIKTFILLTGIFCANILFAETLAYKYNSKEKEIISKMEITKTDTGYLIIESRGKEEHTFNTDASFSVLKWKVINPQDDTDITAERKGEKIIIAGKLKNEEIQKTIKIDDLPWHQEWSVGFKLFIQSGKDLMKFWAIDPTSMKRVAQFQLEKQKTGIIDVNGKKIESVYSWLSPTSRIIRLMWKGQGMWYRKSDGLRVYQNDENGISQLIEEK